ncbi:MAG: hypothetical protein AB7P07_06950 [Hyphomonadaceae bacterium]
MGAIGRILLIIVVVVVIAAGAGYFFLPNTASRTESFTVERPPASVFARLASTPPGTQIAEGVTQNAIVSAENNVVVAEVAYADGSTGLATYTVSSEGDGSRVQLRLEEELGANPLDRVQAITGGEVGPLATAAASTVTADLSSLPAASFVGLPYEVVQIEARPFFYIQNCSPTDAEAIQDVVAQSLLALRPIMQRHRLQESGDPIAVEPRVENDQYCYQIGLPYTGTPPRVLAVGAAGQTPAGTALRMTYTGAEENVVPEIYDRMDALLAAARLDDPGTQADDWTTFEVYHDDPTQAGGSRSREIFYVVQGDVSRLTAIAPPSAVAPLDAAQPAAADPAAAPAAAGEQPAAPAAEAPAQQQPAPTP